MSNDFKLGKIWAVYAALIIFGIGFAFLAQAKSPPFSQPFGQFCSDSPSVQAANNVTVISAANYLAYGCPSDFSAYNGGFSGAGMVCCKKSTAAPESAAAPASCASTPEVKCWFGLNKPSVVNQSYLCVDSPGDCKGTILPDSNCPKGISGVAVCCQMPICTATTAAPTAVKPPSEYKLSNPLGTVSIPVLLGRIIKTFLGIVGGIALMVFVYGGLMWMTSRGDQAQVKKGQDALKAAVIGLFIVMFSYTLAGNLVSFLTSEQQTIASQEGRSTVEKPTEAGNQAATVSSQLKEAADKGTAGQAGAAAAGTEAGVTPQPVNCGQLKGQAYLDCVSASGQSLYNTPNPQAGKQGGQQDCKYALDPSKCSTIGVKTICKEKVFDTGYGTYNNADCLTQADCTGKKGTVLKTSSFGNQCGTGYVCCKVP